MAATVSGLQLIPAEFLVVGDIKPRPLCGTNQSKEVKGQRRLQRIRFLSSETLMLQKVMLLFLLPDSFASAVAMVTWQLRDGPPMTCRFFCLKVFVASVETAELCQRMEGNPVLVLWSSAGPGHGSRLSFSWLPPRLDITNIPGFCRETTEQGGALAQTRLTHQRTRTV